MRVVAVVAPLAAAVLPLLADARLVQVLLLEDEQKMVSESRGLEVLSREDFSAPSTLPSSLEFRATQENRENLYVDLKTEAIARRF